MRTIIALCIIALFTAQVASAGYIYQQTYAADFITTPGNFFCAGQANPVVQANNYTAGACQNNTDNSASWAYYCDGDGAFVIRIDYSTGLCPVESVTTMTRTPTTCGATSVSSMWKCTGTDPLTNSWTFPPSGWLVQTTQYNNTLVDATGESVPACGSVNRPVSIQTATRLYCHNIEATTNTQKTSTQTYAGSSTSDAWSAVFNDFDCKANNLVSLTQGFDQGSCKNGIISSTVQSGGAVAPSIPLNNALSNIRASKSIYAKKDTNQCGGALVSQTWYTNVCSNSMKTECIGNSSVPFTYTESSYVPTANGVCSGTSSTGYPKNQNITAGNCLAAGDYGYTYGCDVAPTSSASMASFSIISLTVAMIIVFLAQ